ncbi:DUF2497 domain-containing protein [Candidatus Finniella inopinata]|uniref:DUF2497 domain-containing protein n=1 Tax=Candidatus Finniella inopinata TaxID=1696036 RepID=A0A4Q7DI66_9PROT|nr:DUF2497 domain-containing protein [Candidatus Finniella inopinata]RZI46661.1 DUF2497 domain-containing protein [Candidatus Finniella inopinata]
MANLRRDDDGEMSIEEILASIRRYVGDDSQPQPQEVSSFSAPKFDPSPAPAPIKVEKEQTTQAFADSLSIQNPDPIDPPLRSAPAPENVIRLTEAHMVRPAPQEAVLKTEIQPEFQEGLLSPQAQAATIQSFAKLAEAAHHVQSAPKSEPTSPTLDQLIGELARPMVKQWLDQHLPRLVELTVAKEIERLTKQLRND